MFADASIARRVQRGLSIIELMVGLVVALLVAIAASGSAIFFTAAQRQGMSTNGTSINTTTALSAIKEDLAQMGLGFFGSDNYLCNSLNLSLGAADMSQDSFSPLQGSRGIDFDQLDVAYANDVAGGANVRLQAPATATAAAVRTFMPAASANAVLLAPAPGTPNPRCTVRSVTQVTAASAPVAQQLEFGAGGAHNRVAFATPAAYVTDDRVALLGSLAWNRYRVVSGNLVIERRFLNDSAVLVRNVVGFRLQYGATATALPGDTTVSAWQDPSGAWATLTPANLPRVRAVRIGIVTRSVQPEKRDENGDCVASNAAPVLFGAAVTALPADWRCFRFRTSVVTVPLRNVAMGLR